MTIPVSIVVPTFNAGDNFYQFAEMIKKQTADIEQVLIIDSSSSDKTIEIAKDFGFAVEVINRKDFGHGRTRQYALKKTNTEIIVFLTQDALLADELAVEKLVKYLANDEKIAAVYGRQLPFPNTGVLGSFARLNNYQEISLVNSFEDRKAKGLKAAFLSDSFAAYKKDLLFEIGGFPEHINFGEDMYAAAKLLMNGYKTGYCAEAMCYHSHDYSLKQEYTRCKEIGRFHKQENWILKTFGKAEDEGFSFIVNEAKYLLKNRKVHYLPIAFMHNVIKFVGYKAGCLF